MPSPLAPILDTPAAADLRQHLRAAIAEGRPLAIDGAGVEQIGLAALQVLAAGRIAADRAGLPFRIEAPSGPMLAMATLAGLRPALALA